MTKPEDSEKKLASLQEQTNSLIAAYAREKTVVTIISFLACAISLVIIVISLRHDPNEIVKIFSFIVSMAISLLIMQLNRRAINKRERKLRDLLRMGNEDLFRSIREDAANKVETINSGGRR